MAIRIVTNKTVRTEVEVYLPTDDNEEESKALFYVWFKIQPKSVKKQRQAKSTEKLKMLGRIAKGGDLSQADFEAALADDTQLEYLLEDITKTEGLEIEISGDDGSARLLAEHNEELLQAALDQSYIRKGIEEKWVAVQNDEIWKREQEKN